MNHQHAPSEGPASESGPESMAELFHLVRSLVPAANRWSLPPQHDSSRGDSPHAQKQFLATAVVEGEAVLGVFSSALWPGDCSGWKGCHRT